MTAVLAQVAAESARAGRAAPPRRVAYLPAEHTDFVWSVDPAGWAVLAAIAAVPLLAGFALGWWARGRRPPE